MTDSAIPAGSPESPQTMEAKGNASTEDILERAKMRGRENGLNCAGILMPEEAFSLAQSGDAVILDVRTLEEYRFVGRVPYSAHVPWMCGLAMVSNPGFVYDVKRIFSKDMVIAVLCRSGKRSLDAAEMLTRSGFSAVYNLHDGFEGRMNDKRQRGYQGGWRFCGLPWEQD